MRPELAHLLLILALLAAGAQAWAGLAPRAQPRLARVALAWQTGAVLAAFGLLGVAFVQDDFSVRYVAQHGHTDLPLVYKLSAVWGGHEGSLLLWALMLALWSALAALWLPSGSSKKIAVQEDWTPTSGQFDPETVWPARVLGWLGLVSLAMLAFILFTSNPFLRLLPAADQGQSLNPLLQDPGLALHPPLLYLGYVGTAVPFAMTMAALSHGAPGGWVRAMRRFVLLAWGALSLGIALGSWWAYYELGWGGWWFWDPVENASFMPWLALAALAHTLAVREARRGLPHWTAVLAIGAFILSLLGTFLVRSGVLTSVHAFASDPRRGVFMLGLIAVFLLGALALYARHAERLLDARGPRPTALASRETAILLNNLLLAVACGTVLLGTLYPLALDALRLGKISVGPPYFEAVLAPVFLLLLALLVPAAWLRWGAPPPPLKGVRRPAVLLGLATAALGLGVSLTLAAWQGSVRLGVALTVVLALAVAGSTLGWAFGRWRRLTAAQWGMVVAHLGVAVFAIGVAVVGGHGVERDVRLLPALGKDGAPTAAGAQARHAIGGCGITFERVVPERGPNYMALRGLFTLACPGAAPRALVAEKRNYAGSSMPMTESAIDWGFTRDLYVALGEPLEATPYGPWSVRVQYKPLMRWVWIGVLLMALGATLAAGARRLRRPAAAGAEAGVPAHPNAWEAA